ncbi:hypothetical protein [Microbulbifer rhizosphaerae]|uniref:Uncharacterized protein n=1 Tax=Microbulbifer rhizosphaerae TaxID=1562603 RepID=A0A7W4WFJ2_9GAMM|nr:hypothetical protein [Microbulbifer rhizosphaerae]MBB3063289.1 hypothetical protein [Microbulbifer rhizosphaerae]
MRDKIEFDLLSNAIDSIDHAIDLLAYDQDLDRPTVSKRAIISLAHAIELLLKERLRQIHPSLIWENVDRYPDLDARTVTAESALRRLKQIGGLDFPEKDEQLLRSIRKTRNAIEHYKWSISSEEAEYITGASLNFATGFLKEYLGKDVLGYAEREGGLLQDLMDRNRSFALSYEKRRSEGKSSKEERCCGFCKALLKTEDCGACPKCGHWNYFGYGGFRSSFDDDIPF